MYYLFGTPLGILDLKKHQKEFNAVSRSIIPIAVIDDEELAYIDILRNHGFNLRQFKDIEDVKAVQSYDIVMCDIKGVGKHFKSRYEGAHLIAEIRKHYPAKILLAYTSHQFDPTYKKFFSMADQVLKKDIDSDEWIESLDAAIKDAVDPVFQWKRLRDYLLTKDTPLSTLIAIEHEFVNSVIRKIEDPFTKSRAVNSIPAEVKTALIQLTKQIVLSALTVKP
jgi:hypothetical protein